MALDFLKSGIIAEIISKFTGNYKKKNIRTNDSQTTSETKGEKDLKEKENKKEDGRYYFYEDRCSFKLDSDLIKNEVEKGNKFILKTKKVEAVIWILPEMPIHSRYPWIVGTDEMEVAGFRCEVAYTKTYSGIIPSYFINCGNFVVQVNLPNNNTKEESEFLNSFRIEN